MMLRYYRVFNVAQTDLPQPELPEAPEDPIKPCQTGDKIESAEEILRAYFEYSTISARRKDRPMVLRADGQVPSYSPFYDHINMPSMGCFDSPEEYYSTFYHEMIHSTGAKGRVTRSGIDWATEGEFSNGKQEYSFEELVAEIGATFLSNRAGIMQKTIDNAKAYCQNWAKHLKSNPKWIVKASSKSAKAVEFVMGDGDN